MTRTKHESQAELDATNETPPFDKPEPRRRRAGKPAAKQTDDHALARQRARERAARDD
jgi:hypothetical protein